MGYVPPPPTRYGPPVVQARPALSAAPPHRPPPLPPRPIFLPAPETGAAIQARLRGPTLPWTPRFPAPTVQAKLARVAQRAAEKEATTGLGEGQCKATLLYDNGNGTSGSFDGEYDGGSYEHAEIAALSAYCSSAAYAAAGGLGAIKSITVSSPCCKVCAYVLGNLGILGKIVSRKGTGSCKGGYGVPTSGVLRKLIYDAIGAMDNPYGSTASTRTVSDYNSSNYWQLLKDKCQSK
jgi:hypothetical protein